MTAAWPSTVNQGVEKDGFSEEPERNVASFKPEVGPEMERQRSSIASDLFTFSNWYTAAEWTDLVDFYRTTLRSGVLPFTRNHPRTGVTCTFKFTAAPKITSARGVYFIVSHAMRSMP